MFIEKGPYLQKPAKNSMIICWVTDVESSSQVRVYEGYHAQVPASKFPAYEEALVFSGEPGLLHSVEVTGLKTFQEYYYEVVSEADGDSVISDKALFKTAPDEETAFSFVLTAENGGICNPSNPYVGSIVELIRRERPDFIQSVGDIVSNGMNAPDWDIYFFGPFRGLLRNTPFYPCVGNHEAADTAVPDCEMEKHYHNYENYFAVSRNYSYDYGCAHFAVLDCPSMFEAVNTSDSDNYITVLKPDFENSEAYRFLVSDLEASNAKWKFVVFHYPPYTSSIFDVPQLQVLAPIFEKYGVDVVFNSHAIVYDRSHPVKGGKVAKDGVRYILVGGYGDLDDWFREKQNGLSAKICARPNYVHVAITPWRFELQAFDYEGKLFDTLTLEK